MVLALWHTAEVGALAHPGSGIVVDRDKNSSSDDGIREIQATGSSVRVLVVPTDEELEIARQTMECINAHRGADE